MRQVSDLRLFFPRKRPNRRTAPHARKWRRLSDLLKVFGYPSRKLKNRHRRDATDLGENPIKRFHTNLLATTLAPIVLGGCFLPAGVQIASFFAEGVSLMTTDKTLGDHGLSAVTNQDCAVWRVINDEEICRDYEPGDSPVMVANANSDAAKAPEELSPTVGLENSLVDADDMNLVGAPEIEIASLKPIDAPTKPTIIPAIEEDPIVPTLPTAENTRTDEPSPTPTAVKISGGTFFVIASFSRISGAKRFARRHAALAMQVFAGTAKGKTVYRVATGPVDKTQRPTVRGKLIDVGFDDVWALKLKAPKVVVKLAALN